MARLRLARYAAVFPVSVVEGMLGAIGILILIKALPLFLGFQGAVHAHGFDEYLSEIPHWVAEADPAALAVGIASLVALFGVSGPLARRFAILETLYFEETLRRMVVEGRSVDDIKHEAVKQGMLTLRRVGILNALRGVTSLEEVLRVTLGDD